KKITPAAHCHSVPPRENPKPHRLPNQFPSDRRQLTHQLARVDSRSRSHPSRVLAVTLRVRSTRRSTSRVIQPRPRHVLEDL
ncbi:unnamed protein product, partial [Linum tenue]